VSISLPPAVRCDVAAAQVATWRLGQCRLAAIPAILVAVTKGPELVAWTLAAYILIHQAEGNLIMPLIQRRMIYIPPALMLLGITGSGALAGLLGFLLAAPIVVAIFVTVQKAYVRDTLKEDVTLPGEKPTGRA
jgi:predicted PurR-regulated permease PerM